MMEIHLNNISDPETLKCIIGMAFHTTMKRRFVTFQFPGVPLTASSWLIQLPFDCLLKHSNSRGVFRRKFQKTCSIRCFRIRWFFNFECLTINFGNQ